MSNSPVKFTVRNAEGAMCSLEGVKGVFVYVVPSDWFVENVKDSLPDGLVWGPSMSDYLGEAYACNSSYSRIAGRCIPSTGEHYMSISTLFRLASR